jgi:YVTN family beta-propeller protein
VNLRISGLLAILAFALASILGSVQSLAQNAYIANLVSRTVSVIDTATNKVTATIPVSQGSLPEGGVAATPDGSKVYFTNVSSQTYPLPGTVSVIDTATNRVIATIPVGNVITAICTS